MEQERGQARVVAYNPNRHVRNASGRWYDRIGKRLVSIDPATLPEAPGPSAPMLDLLEGVPPPPVPEPPAAPAPAESAPGGAPAAPAGAPSPAVVDLDAGGAAGVGSAAPPASGLPGLEGGGLPSAHVHGCWRAASEGTLCACGAKVFPRPSPKEVAGMVTMHEIAVNRFVPHPRPYSDTERAMLAEAFADFGERYGNPMVRWAPILAVVGSTMFVAAERRAELPAPPAPGVS